MKYLRFLSLLNGLMVSNNVVATIPTVLSSLNVDHALNSDLNAKISIDLTNLVIQPK